MLNSLLTHVFPFNLLWSLCLWNIEISLFKETSLDLKYLYVVYKYGLFLIFTYFGNISKYYMTVIVRICEDFKIFYNVL